jgi:hypothetical protein
VIESEDAKRASNNVTSASFKDLMTAIGYLMFQWSLVEEDLQQQISHLRREGGDNLHMPNRMRATINERLGEWRALLGTRRRNGTAHAKAIEVLAERIRAAGAFRNLVGHGFVTASAEAVEPWLSCINKSTGYSASSERRISLSGINDMIDEMGRCRAELRRFGSGSSDDVPAFVPDAWQVGSEAGSAAAA